MPTNPRRLKLIEKELAKLPIDSQPMMLSELDGSLAGIAVCPDTIVPSEWLPIVWHKVSLKADVVAETDQAERLMRLVLGHYSTVASDLQKGRYQPVLDVDIQHGEIFWQIWIGGFATAVNMRLESWTSIPECENTRTALAGLFTLAAIDRGDSDLPKQEIDDLSEAAPDLIPRWMKVLKVGRQGHKLPISWELVIPRFGRLGRNRPCPCGSGKSYSKCCGLN